MTDDASDFGTLCRLTSAMSEPDAGVEVAWDRADWARVRDLADEHRLSGYLFLELQKHPSRRLVPPEVVSHWKQYYLRQWTKNELLMAETARLAAAFERDGLDVLFMKGPLLAQRVYGRLDARAISDIDLLARRASEVPKVEACLLSCGYTRTSRILITHALTERFTYQLEYWKDEIPVELHWNLQSDVSLRLDMERIWRDADSIGVEGRTYRLLSREDAVLAYTVSVPVDLRIGKLAARTLFEIYLLLGQLPAGFDWDAWLARRAAEGTRRLSAAVAACALALFDPRGRFEKLSRSLAPFVRDADRSTLLTALAAPSSLSPWKRGLGALRLSESTLGTALAWWAMSLPARILAHPTESKRHLPWT
jgi:hypothetical protein